jgi:hypothetical protein
MVGWVREVQIIHVGQEPKGFDRAEVILRAFDGTNNIAVVINVSENNALRSGGRKGVKGTGVVRVIVGIDGDEMKLFVGPDTAWRMTEKPKGTKEPRHLNILHGLEWLRYAGKNYPVPALTRADDEVNARIFPSTKCFHGVGQIAAVSIERIAGPPKGKVIRLKIYLLHQLSLFARKLLHDSMQTEDGPTIADFVRMKPSE